MACKGVWHGYTEVLASEKRTGLKSVGEAFCMAMWQMEMWDNRVEDELFWRRVKRGIPWMRQKQRWGSGGTQGAEGIK